jgi:hypothetical protein
MAAKPKKPAKAAKEDKTPAPVEKRPRGRPSAYTEALADEICRRLASGESLSSICRSDHMPERRTVLQWKLDNYQGFHSRYARAREVQLAAIADELLDLTDDSRNDFMEREDRDGNATVVVDREHLDRTKLRVDTRKWLLTKLMPSTFGDKVDLKHDAGDAFLQLWQNMSGGKPRDET